MARRQIFLKDDVWSALHAEATASSRSVGNMLTLILAERYRLRVFGDSTHNHQNPSTTPYIGVQTNPLPTFDATPTIPRMNPPRAANRPAPPLPTYDVQPTTTAGAPTRRWMAAEAVHNIVKCEWFLWPVTVGTPPEDDSSVVITTDTDGKNWYVSLSYGQRWEYPQ